MFDSWKDQIDALKRQIITTSKADPFHKDFPEALALTIAWALNHAMSAGFLDSREERDRFKKKLVESASFSIRELAESLKE